MPLRACTMLAAAATFGNSYFIQSLGAVVIGADSDKRGKKMVIIWLMAIGTLVTACASTYAMLDADDTMNFRGRQIPAELFGRRRIRLDGVIGLGNFRFPHLGRIAVPFHSFSSTSDTKYYTIPKMAWRMLYGLGAWCARTGLAAC
jgi:hypothetical protein